MHTTKLITIAMNNSFHLPNSISTVRLWQLISPALPIGAYSFSQGLEYAVETGWVSNEPSACEWIAGLAENNLGKLDVPVFARLYKAWETQDMDRLLYWNDFLLACRESAELKNEDVYLGGSLKKLINDLQLHPQRPWPDDKPASFATMFTLAATHWHIPQQQAAMGYLWAWIENQVAAAIKLVPLGQVAGQRILSNSMELIPKIIEDSHAITDEQIGAVAPGLAIASALHETQYTRLFRS